MTGPGINLQKHLSRAGKTTLTGLVAAVMSWLVLFGTLQAALSVPSEERLSPLARAGALDYTLGPHGLFESLRSGFIAKILGLEPPTPTVAIEPSSDGSILAAPFVPASAVPIPGRLPRTIVEHTFDNDDFDDAYAVPTIPFTGRTDTRGARREEGEPDTCEPAGGTVWYRYRPTKDVGLLANTFGSDHGVALGVFQGGELSELTLVGCDVHPEGNAQWVFPAKKGHTYAFQVAAPVSGGRLVFSLDPIGATRMVSVARGGKRSTDNESKYSAVSEDGRYVSFHSYSDKHVWRKEKKTCFWRHTDTYDCPDIYVRDMVTNRTELVSKNSRGASSNGLSVGSAISGDGRYVVFQSIGTNLVRNDNNDAADIFVHDRLTQRTERVSVSSEGEEGTVAWVGNRVCKYDVPRTIPALDHGYREFCNPRNLDLPGIGISSNGRYVVYASMLHGLVEPDPPHCSEFVTSDHYHGPSVGIPRDDGISVNSPCRQIYVRDRKTDETRLVSVSTDGEAGAGDSGGPFISRNGRWVAFSSTASNLVDNDVNGRRDVFVHDLRTRTTELVSVSTWGTQGDGQSGGTHQRGHNTVSDDGRWVAFVSHASNLAENDGNHTDDIYLRDRWSGQTVLVTGASDSPSAPSDLASAGHSSISSDGRYIAFVSELGDSVTPRQELFVYDRVYDTFTRVSVATSGAPCRSEGTGFSHEPELSADGHFVSFESTCHNFDKRYRDEKAWNGFDVFIHELPWVR